MNKSLLLLGAGAVGLYMYAKGANKLNAIKRLGYTNPKITVGNFNLFSGLGLIIKLDFINNSSEDIPIEYFNGAVRYQGNDFARFTFNANGQNMVIKARSVTPLPFSVKVSTFGAINVIKQLISAISNHTGLPTILSVDATYYAAGIDVPVRFDYDVKTQQLLRMPPMINNS